MGSATIKSIAAEHPYLGNAIFIVGSGRCGSTLLRSLFDDHPQLVTWPFEFPYFSLFKSYAGERSGPLRVAELIPYFTDIQFRHLYGYAGDLGRRHYTLDTVDTGRFFSVLRQHEDELVDRKEFLQLVVFAYAASRGVVHDPSAFIVTLGQPCSSMLQDFPQAYVLAMVRHPLHTYVSTKRYYFKAADLSQVDRCAVYRPRAANQRYRWGLLETAVSPSIFTYDWILKNGQRANIHSIRLEDLQGGLEPTMREAVEFLGIQFDWSLLRPTITGKSHESNLSTGESSNGTVLEPKWKEAQHYTQDLTSYELWWVGHLLEPACVTAGYELDSQVPRSRPGVASFLSPLRHEFPGRNSIEGRHRHPLSRWIRRGARWMSALVNYIVNRWVFLTYAERDVFTRWPYAK